MFEFQKRRIVHLGSYISEDHFGQSFIVATKVEDNLLEKITRSGLTIPLTEGHSILPKIIGAVSRFNSEGKYISLKNLPKETYYQHREFTRRQWIGGGETEEVTSDVWIERKRYQRQFIEPPGVEFQILSVENVLYVAIKPIQYNAATSISLKHAINLLLEYFGQCVAFPEGSKPIRAVREHKVNWKILPKGRFPWDEVERHIRDSLAAQPRTSLVAALDRFKNINSLNPSFRISGIGGYSGYVVFAFENQHKYVLESQFTNNAIYIFGDQWEELSKLSKAEILAGRRHIARIIHTPNWFNELQRYIRQEPEENEPG